MRAATAPKLASASRPRVSTTTASGAVLRSVSAPVQSSPRQLGAATALAPGSMSTVPQRCPEHAPAVWSHSSTRADAAPAFWMWTVLSRPPWLKKTGAAWYRNSPDAASAMPRAGAPVPSYRLVMTSPDVPSARHRRWTSAASGLPAARSSGRLKCVPPAANTAANAPYAAQSRTRAASRSHAKSATTSSRPGAATPISDSLRAVKLYSTPLPASSTPGSSGKSHALPARRRPEQRTRDGPMHSGPPSSTCAHSTSTAFVGSGPRLVTLTRAGQPPCPPPSVKRGR